MLSNILGAVTVLMGILWLAKPEILKNRLKRKMSRKLRMTVYGFIVVFGFLILRSVMKVHGLLPRIVGIIGMVVMVKGILLLMTNASQKMQDWLAERPAGFFKVWALFIIATGIMLILA